MHLIIVSIISVSIYLIQSLVIHLLPPLPIAIPIFLGTAISLILSFNLNQSYERWWEARKIWGSIVNDSRSLIIQLKTFTKPGNEEVIKKIAYRQIAWSYCFGQSLREEDPMQNITQFLSEDELEKHKNKDSKPLALLENQSVDISRLEITGQLNVFHHVQIDTTLVGLCNSMGQAERIAKTVFPRTYSLYLHYLIYIFIIMLSISLSEIDGYFEIPMLILISIPFLLLEQTAKQMQDPFTNSPTDTPVTSIANTIEKNLTQLINETYQSKSTSEEDFFIS